MEVDPSQPSHSNDNPKRYFSKADQCHNESNVMAPSTLSAPALSVSLHPLVIMNVSEHWTRIRAQENSSQVYGALIGKQKGRNIEIMNSFELMFDKIEGNIIFNDEYYATKEAQFKQVFPDLDFLGWYTTGDAPNESDLNFHKQICKINESPLFLKLNPMVFDTRSIIDCVI